MLDNLPKKEGLYDPINEHDACGIGAVININGEKSHDIIDDGLEILTNLKHRGGTGAEDNTGDGAGILLQLPHEFFSSQLSTLNLSEGNYAVAQIFASQNEEKRKEVLFILEDALLKENIKILAYRNVPTNSIDLGKTALDAMPYIMQVIVEKPKDIEKGICFERKLYEARRIIENRCIEEGKEDLYFCSFSSKTIVYKGMLLATQVKNFYIDLQNVLFKSALVLVHSRFSTNTFPSWERAHPNRFIVHNGEINTIRGNVDSIKAREGQLKSSYVDLGKALPIIAKPSSDSAMFDNTLEFMYINGRSLPEILMMMIPEPWSKDDTMSRGKKDFYEYNSLLMESWDGPASIISTDGDVVVASLDRNGLRPSRYYLTKDGMLILSSEVGSFKVEEENISKKSRLEPGKILVVDLNKKRLISDEEIKEEISNNKPYNKWLKSLLKLENVEIKGYLDNHYTDAERIIKQVSFGYKYDTLELGIMPMASKGEEELVSMGHDVPLAILSNREQPLYNYFKQLFAQVTNPPIDSIRESIVTSSRMYIGGEGDILNPSEENAKRVKIGHSIITNEEMYKIRNLDEYGFKSHTIDIVFDYNLEEALLRISEEAEKAIDEGNSIIILSDKAVNEKKTAIPALLATSAVHSYLVEKSLRTKASLIVESGEPREIHHYACLIGFGATAINPYLVYETIYELVDKKMINLPFEDACHNYIKTSMKSLVKIISKMGISTMQAYNGACIFEALGLSSKLVDKYFTGVSSKIEGLTIEDIQKQSLEMHRKAYEEIRVALDSEGMHNLRNGKEEHLYNPFTIYQLQTACRNNDYKMFKEFTKQIDGKTNNLRNLLSFDYGKAISIDEVESVDEIVKRFKTGAMSYGSISQEAHECLAIAMNRLNAKSNTGEGGELVERYKILENGDSKASAIVQVASGRFGVTMEYLVNAKEIQIKMAQGAKPGEGGQLPGKKVYPWVAKARHSTPGVSLISPPPHHDIYSIEDLAQLIYDLKNANRDVKISVKLVSENGIGTVASGVAKAGANVILISGYDGGTGASPRTSISNAGMPWEIGLADAHQTLILNNLRERVLLEVDGKLLTGKDLAVAALLGADEFGFATAPLIAMGCVMMRVCNLDTCPVGIATQNEELRKRFAGKPEHVINFMRFIASELREYMALLGFRKLDEMIGRTDLLKAKDGKVDLSSIIHNSIVFNKTNKHFKEIKKVCFNDTIDERVLLPLCKETIENKKPVSIDIKIKNTNRTFSTILSSVIVGKYGSSGLCKDTIKINAYGNAGNSFGAFATNGISLTVIGDANDYLGKGLCGGIISVKTNEKSTFNPCENIIVGNVTLYGATSGAVYLDGLAGERFAVRNSGADAVVLGVGQHGCEYMTGGTVLILGSIGKNFAAGMSGGKVYILDCNSNSKHINTESVDIIDLSLEDEKQIKEMMNEHIKRTNSCYVKEQLKEFNGNKYFKVMPREYRKLFEANEELKKKEANNQKEVK